MPSPTRSADMLAIALDRLSRGRCPRCSHRRAATCLVCLGGTATRDPETLRARLSRWRRMGRPVAYPEAASIGLHAVEDLLTAVVAGGGGWIEEG